MTPRGNRSGRPSDVLGVDQRQIAQELLTIVRSEPGDTEASLDRLRLQLKELRWRKLLLLGDLERVAKEHPNAGDLGLPPERLLEMVELLRQDGLEEDDTLTVPPSTPAPVDLLRLKLPLPAMLDPAGSERCRKEVGGVIGQAVRYTALTQGLFEHIAEREEEQAISAADQVLHPS
jgi:hypothetical protein